MTDKTIKVTLIADTADFEDAIDRARVKVNELTEALRVLTDTPIKVHVGEAVQVGPGRVVGGKYDGGAVGTATLVNGHRISDHHLIP